MPKIKISILSLIVIPIVLLDPQGELAATVIAAFIHELGHLAVILLCGLGVTELGVTPYGLEIITARRYRSFIEELAVYCAGCTVNFITFFLLSPYGGFAFSLARASLLLGTLNALPVVTLDGGESLHALLSILLPFRLAERISHLLSFITLVIMWTFAAYIFLFSGYNYSLFIMSVWLFGKIYCQS